MFGMPKSFSTAIAMIFKDPINLFLAIVPTIMAFALYLLSITLILKNSNVFEVMFRRYIYTADHANLLANVMAGILIVFVFFLMSWTFVIVVGILAAPFNSMLSSRIEAKLCGKIVSTDKDQTIKKMFAGLGNTFINEIKKLFFVLIMAGAAMLLNIFPLFYPLGLVILALLISIQFVDYTWSRHNISFGNCLADTLKNFIPYTLSGLAFLMLVSIPFINAIVPAFATSYYTVLWIHRQKKLPSQLT